MKQALISEWTEEYIKAVEGEWSLLRVGDAQIPLEDVYVMLQALPTPSPRVQEKRLELGVVPERLEHAGLERDSRFPMAAPVALSQALRDAHNLVLLGEPGSGKSTVLQFIGLCFVHTGWSRSRLLLQEERIPVKINLREHAELLTRPGPGLEKALANSVREYLRRRSEEQALELIQSWQDQDRLLVLLDGLDEVPDALRSAVQDEINKFTASEHGRKCRLMVSSRPAGYASLGGTFQEFTLKPFEKAKESKPFLQGWLSAFRPDWPKKKAESEASWLYDYMAARPALLRILDNPLILRLSAQVYAGNGRERMARNRADLYRLYTDELWDRAVHDRGVDVDQKKAVWEAIELLAWQLQLDQKPDIPEEILFIIHEQMGLVAWGGEVLVFSHTTFQEYFVGQRLSRAWLSNRVGAWAFLHPRLHIPSWREPILLMDGSLDGKSATDLVHRVLHARSPFEQRMFRDWMMAASLIAENEGVEGREQRLLMRDLHRMINGWGKFAWGKRRQNFLPVLFRTLAEMKVEETVPDLIRVLETDRDWIVRSAAAEALGEMRAEKAVPKLRQSLNDRNWSVRSASARSLGVMKTEEAVPDLLSALKYDRSGRVRSVAAWALGKLNVVEVVPDLLLAIKYDPDGRVRSIAVGALVEMKTVKAVPDLLLALKDEDRRVRSAVRRALAKMKKVKALPDLLQELKDKDERVRFMAVRSLGKLDAASAVPDLLLALKNDRSGRVRSVAAWALGELNALTAVPDLLVALKGDPDRRVRRAVVYALGDLNAIEAVPDLLWALKYQDGNVRYDVVGVLGRMSAMEAVPDLLQVFKNQSGRVRRKVARALGNLKAVEAIPNLLQTLQRDRDGRVRSVAAWALGKMNEVTAVPDLLLALKDQDGNVRHSAAYALTTIFSTTPISNDVLSSSQKIKIMRTLATHKLLDYRQQRVMANSLAALQAARSSYQDPLKKYQAPPTQKAVRFVLIFLIFVLLVAIGVILETFYGTVQDAFKNSIGPLIEPWIRDHVVLAIGLLSVLGVVIVIVAIYRDRFADLLPGKSSKGA
ncbi:MAG: HEAT repeat domain-containing protein [Anaerolineales bacterium]|jgi:HEAT repeat protein